MKIGRWILEEKKKIKLKDLASALEVDERTLRNWKMAAKANGKRCRIGRPPIGEREKFLALIKVGREWRRQGCPGWRPVSFALQGAVPTRLIQKIISRLKLLQRSKTSRRLAAVRETIVVDSKNILWVQDATIVGRRSAGLSLEFIKDRASKVILSATSQREEELIPRLDRLKKARGLPLVWATDRGSAYLSSAVKEYLHKNKVVHLKSLPRTPQHNGAAEVGIRELKETALASNLPICEAAEILNNNRLRASLGFKSAGEIDDKMPVLHNEKMRSDFFEACELKIEKVRRDSNLGAKEKNREERKVILKMLENFGLIKITRGLTAHT